MKQNEGDFRGRVGLFLTSLEIKMKCTDLRSLSWVRTGDEVYVNELAEIFIVDRMKVRNLIIFSDMCLTAYSGNHES